MMKIRIIITIMFIVLFNRCFAATVMSPDGNIRVDAVIKDKGECSKCVYYRVSFKGKSIIDDSRLGFDLDDGVLSDHFELISETESKSDVSWEPVYGERNVIRDNYNQLSMKMKQDIDPGHELEIVFRCYNEGVAFKYIISGRDNTGKILINSENTEFRFLEDHYSWQATSAQGKYSKKKISNIWASVERPLTVKIDENVYIAIAEAGLVDYARMKLGILKNDPVCAVSRLSSKVESSLPLVTPWRVIMIGESPGELLENNYIILNLNEPNRIDDVSWIKPGKVLREVTLTTQGGKASVDFAAGRNLQYVEFDAGWYGDEKSDESDATTVTLDPKRSSGPLDLQEVIRYADDRGIGIILYVNRRHLERQLDDLLPLYKEWGIKGLKYGFVQVGDQKWTAWLHEAVRKAASYQMMVDVHDEYRPTGYSRTYPNLMTQEGIGGDETSPENSQTLTILFTRMLAGAGDNTICYYDSRVDKNATHAYQLAKAVNLYSPWQFLYWYDRPKDAPGKKGGAGGEKNVIGDDPELEFYDSIPTVWDDTKVIYGEIGEYAVIARRTGDEWYIGGMNNDVPRTLNVRLDFLHPDKKYTAHIYSDDMGMNTGTNVKIERVKVTDETIMKFELGKNGGQAVRLAPAAGDDEYPEYQEK